MTGIVEDMKVEVDREKCIGAATCVMIAPDVFELDSEMKAVVKDVKAASPEVILEAAQSCPTLAISVFDDAGKRIFP